MTKDASNQWCFNNDARYQCTWKVIEIGIKQRIRRKKMIKLKIGSWKWKRLMTKLRSRWRAFAHDQYKQSTERVKLGMRKRGEVNENIGKGSCEIEKGKRRFRLTRRRRDGEIVRRWVTWTRGKKERNKQKDRQRWTEQRQNIATKAEAESHSIADSADCVEYWHWQRHKCTLIHCPFNHSITPANENI